jgi:GAF domain-containing protein
MRIRAALTDKEEPATSSPLSSSLALSVFHEVFLALSQEEDIATLLGLIAQKARLLTDAASAAILLRTDKPEELTFAAVAGEGSAEMQGTRVHQRDTVAGNTARTGQPYIAYHPMPHSGTNNHTESTRSAAVVAIFEKGKTVGAIAVLNKCDDQPFGGDDLMGLSTLAAATSTALSNAHLRGDTEARQKELTVLYESVCQVAMPLSAQEVLESLVAQIKQYLDALIVVTFLFNDERTHLYIAAQDGLPFHLGEVTLSSDSGLTPLLLSRNHPVFLTLCEPEERESGNDILEGTISIENPFPDLPLRVGLAAPIRSDDVVHGLVLVASINQASRYRESDAQLLTALSLQAAIAVENAMLYEDAARRAEEATALYDLSVSLNQCQTQTEILDFVAEATIDLLTVENFAIFLLDGTTETLNLVAERGLADGIAERLRPRLGEGIIGWVAEFETPTAVQDVIADHRNTSYPIHEEGVVSMIGMPLQVGAATIGVLCALHTRRRLFTILEVELLYTIANQTAVALDNARLGRDRIRLSRDNRFLRRLLEEANENPAETEQERTIRLHKTLCEEYGGDFAILTVSPNGKYDGGWQRLVGYDDAFLRRQLPPIEDGYITSIIVTDMVMRQSFSQDRSKSITRAGKRADLSDDIPDSLLALAARLL